MGGKCSSGHALGDAYTGWESASRIMIDEVSRPQSLTTFYYFTFFDVFSTVAGRQCQSLQGLCMCNSHRHIKNVTDKNYIMISFLLQVQVILFLEIHRFL